MTRPTVALVVFSTGGAAVTMTVSVASPSVSVGLKPSVAKRVDCEVVLTERLEALRGDLNGIRARREGPML